MERKISEINDFFRDIENLFECQPEDDMQYHSEVDKKFKEGKELIDKLEEDDEKQYGIFRYIYHTKYVDHFKKRGDVENANSQEKLVKRYEKYAKTPQKADIYKKTSISFTDAALEDENNIFEKHIKEAVEEELKKIKNILDDHFINQFREKFYQLFDVLLKTFLDYYDIIGREVYLRNLADNPITEELINPEMLSTEESGQAEKSLSLAKKSAENRETLLCSLDILKKLVREVAYLKRIYFVKCVLNSSDKEAILFNNVSFTNEGINKRFRELSWCFHPDRTNQPNTPCCLNKSHENLGNQLFKAIVKSRESLLKNLEEVSRTEGYLTFHEKKGNNLWRTSIDFRNAAKGQWNKLKLLEKHDIERFSSDELNYHSKEYGKLAYNEYQAACKIADKIKQLEKQVELRGYMALCLYVSDKPIEAQIYALSAIQLQHRNSHKITYQDVISAKKIFDKVKGMNTNIEIKMDSQETSIFDRKKDQRLINEAFTELSTKLILPDQSLGHYHTSRGGILSANVHTIGHYAAGGTFITGAGSLGLAAISTAVAFEVLLSWGILSIGLGIWAGAELYKKGTILLEEPKARQGLNKIMADAIGAYDNGNYQEFLNILSKEYIKGARILRFEKAEDIIVPKEIIKSLLSHGFRSDGISYLLTLLGTALCSGKIRIKGLTIDDLKKKAADVFRGVLNEELVETAKKMDKRVCELLRKNVEKFIGFFRREDHSGEEDTQETLFQSRLEETRNIARFNLAIFDILTPGPEQNERANETIKEIRTSINKNYQFFGIVEKRLEAIDDLLWVISSNERLEEPLQIAL